jgi:hypothetical protein
MKYLSSQFGFLFAAGETRANLKALLRYFAFLIVMVSAYAVVFHLIMIRMSKVVLSEGCWNGPSQHEKSAAGIEDAADAPVLGNGVDETLLPVKA